MPELHIKILGASASKAHANLYLNGKKIGEVIIQRESTSQFDLYQLLGSTFKHVEN